MKIAKADKEDFKSVLEFMNACELSLEKEKFSFQSPEEIKADSGTSSPTIANENVGCWALSNLKEKIKYHLEMSVKAWHDWNEVLPTQVEVISNEISKKYGKVLNVKRWLISPAQSGLKECLVAEIDIKKTSKFSSNAFVQIHINHLVPAVG